MSVEAAELALRGDRDEGLHREPKFGGRRGVRRRSHTKVKLYIHMCVYISTLQAAICNRKRPFHLSQLDSCFHVQGGSNMTGTD